MKRAIMNPPSWTEAYIASLSSKIDDKVLPIPTLPQSVSESISLNTSDQAIVARWAPIVSYINTNARTISLTYAIADEYMPTKANGDQYSINEYANALKSLEYPNYLSNEVVVPQCVLKLANIKLAGIVTSVQINWNGPVSTAAFGSAVSTYTRADVSLQFKEVSNTVHGSIKIKSGE